MALIVRKHAGNREKACLHDRVDPPAHVALTRNLVRIDREKAHAPLDDLPLRLLRQLFPDALRPVRRVEKKHTSGRDLREDVEALKEEGLMAGRQTAPR